MKPFEKNCPINEETGDGTAVGRCWYYLHDGKTCPRHGDVTIALKHYQETGRTMRESTFRLQGGGLNVSDVNP